ncbi:MAG TPA: tetratricopeptide repeat protein [Pyrinomonadaceae bacterium]|nr:tetratricopeptide repeat protein [Pyrinomonadaceae bacterium]
MKLVLVVLVISPALGFHSSATARADQWFGGGARILNFDRRCPAAATDRNVCPTPAILQKPTPGSDFLHRPPPPVSAQTKRNMEKDLEEARARQAANPHDPDAIIWVGRRLGYLGRFVEAIQVYTEGANEFPRDARFYRHRGHRYLTLRKFDLAIQDFEKAAKLIKGKSDEVEPDGQPNARNIPTSTLQFNIWYHLGLAHYLKGNNEKALDSYRKCLKVSKNPDALVATTHWLYMTLRRLKRLKEAIKVLAPINDKMVVIENDGYYRLLLMYKGQRSAEALEADAEKQGASPGSLSVLYGIGNWYLLNDREQDARRVFRKMLEGNQWTSFGYIAAEAELNPPKPLPRPK